MSATYIWHLDIETLPTQSSVHREELVQAVLDAPPRSMSKPETIAKWRKGPAQATIEERIRATALNGAYGEICSIAWAINSGPVSFITRDGVLSEKTLLVDFFQIMKEDQEKRNFRLPRFCGHNIAWDLKFLWQRSVINNVTLPVKLPWRESAWTDWYIDTMALWEGYRDRISLKSLCAVLGIDVGIEDIDGSQVWDMWQAKEYEKITAHNVADVERVQKIYERIGEGAG